MVKLRIFGASGGGGGGSQPVVVPPPPLNPPTATVQGRTVAQDGNGHDDTSRLLRTPRAGAVVVPPVPRNPRHEVPPVATAPHPPSHLQQARGSSTSSRKKKAAVVVSLFDSPRRAIMKRMGSSRGNMTSSAGGSGSGGTTSTPPATSTRASAPPATNEGRTPGDTSSSMDVASSINRPNQGGEGGRGETQATDNVRDSHLDGLTIMRGTIPFEHAPTPTPFPSPSSFAAYHKRMDLDETNAGMSGETTATMNALQWLHDEAPQDLLPKVLSFAGPRKMASLAVTCKSWRGLVMSEAVWRTVCEDTRKWSNGDPLPRSWLQYYRDNPMVPVDYNTVESAFAVANASDDDFLVNGTNDAANINPRVPEQLRSIRILLRPGKYVIRESLVVHAVAAAEVTIETVEDAPETVFVPDPDPAAPSVGGFDMTPGQSSSPGRRGLTRRASSIRDLLTCRSMSATADPAQGLIESELASSSFDNQDIALSSSHISRSKRASIILKTRRHNEPVLRVRQGTLIVKRVDLVHNCPGTDIWNGNAAVQIQPPFDGEDNPVQPTPPSIRPTAYLSHMDISSVSGRGIVNIDGGNTTIENCYIHHCAATGIYVGGPGSQAIIERTDVVRNGNGNERSRRGIARGHSGVYLEQGLATIRDSNISNNSLTGISAISSENATIEVVESDLVANGSIQLEMPPNGSVSRRRSVARDNTVANRGIARSRSGLVPEEEVIPGSIPSLYREQPQSPAADAVVPPPPPAADAPNRGGIDDGNVAQIPIMVD